MITDNQISALEKRLLLIEKDIEEENERANINRMKARYFMFFLLIGADEETRVVLERKVRDLLRNPDACEFINISLDDRDADYGKEVERVILRSSNRHVDVQNLNTVFFCPVVFAAGITKDDISSVLLSIDSYVLKTGRTAVWQPFVVINRNVAQYTNIYRVVTAIRDFVENGREGSINRCCLLSDQDGNGFMVPKENIMQTIAMTVVLQNVETTNVGATQSIQSRVTMPSNAKNRDNLFFTARNAAVVNPIRSIVLERIRSAIDYFSGKTDRTSEAALGRVDYSFVNQIVRPYINKLPHVGSCVSFFPLYSVVESADLQRQLQETINRFYSEPLQSAVAQTEQLQKAKEEFLKRFFSANGSLGGLRDLITDKKLENLFMQYAKNCFGDINIEPPLADRKKLQSFNRGLYAAARQHCEGIVRKAGLSLLEGLAAGLSDSDMLASVVKAQDSLDSAKAVIGERLRKLKDVETVLVLDQTVQRSGFDEIQSEWLKERAEQNTSEYVAYNRRFDAMVYELIIKDIEDYSEILSVCYEAVKGSGYSNLEYLRRVSDECANHDRAHEFANAVEKSWCYTLRFLKHDEAKDITCIIGDPQNRFCDVLCDRFKATLFEFRGFDRIDVLHISDPFAPENIREWEQILKTKEQVTQ